ncbi:MscL family protein [Nocardioides perillae]|uniref:Large conductance mechanosensitive channel n=1 Tax=Nocardioides perillae TaxID=1119534 RepID=A0A7Y9RVE4_9ACTN|nr:large conductance mechanosensitive channel [Nocardioides perillae]
MSGFKNFLLRGNLVDLAVAVIIGTAFGAVVTAFTAWLTSKIPAVEDVFAGTELGDLGFFLNALISFIVLAAVVYFAVVLPYTKARERFFPSPPPGTPEEIELLRQIRDALQAQAGTGSVPGTGTQTPGT